MTSLTLTRDQVREVDRRAIEEWGFSGLVLMENAGRGVVDVLEKLDPTLPHTAQQSPVTIVCGKGNNAGDGFVVARHLASRGIACRVLLTATESELRGDARMNLHLIRECQLPIIDLMAAPPLAELLAARGREWAQTPWLIDGLLGTGSQGPPRPPYDALIRWMNEQSCQKLALDVPSGLDCDSGQAAEPTFRADHTCTFVAQKVGFQSPDCHRWTGAVHVVSIGIPPALLA